MVISSRFPGVPALFCSLFLLSTPGAALGAAEADADLARALSRVQVALQGLSQEQRMERVTLAQRQARELELRAEERRIRERIGRLPRDARRATTDAASDLSRAQLEVLRPQWAQEYKAFYLAQQEAEKQAARDAIANAPTGAADRALAQAFVDERVRKLEIDHLRAVGRISQTEHDREAKAIQERIRALQVTERALPSARRSYVRDLVVDFANTQVPAREAELAPEREAYDRQVAAERAEVQRQAAVAAAQADRQRRERAAAERSRREEEELINSTIWGAVLIICFIGMILAYRRQTRRPYGFDPLDPMYYNGPNGRLAVHYRTGQVLNVTKERTSETHVSGGGGGGTGGQTASVNISSTVINRTYLQFFLREPDGDETPFQFTDFDVPMREGQLLSVVWLIPVGAETGRYVGVYNHSTRTSYIWDSSLAELMKIDLTLVGLLSLPFLMIPLVIFALIRGGAVDTRVKRFERQFDETLLPELVKRAAREGGISPPAD